jgi:AcrR family transcriptional regulator
MARAKDQQKRQLILQAAKMLFSQRGFFNTSVSDITKETGLPVGSIYTYFKGKEEIVRAIVSEGWDDLRSRLVVAVESAASAEDKLRVLIDRFLPEVLNDLDLVNILLSEAITYTKIEEKVEEMSTIILSLLKTITRGKNNLAGLDKNMMDTALVVYFLGVLAAVKISRASDIGLKTNDILKFIRFTVCQALGINL